MAVKLEEETPVLTYNYNNLPVGLVCTITGNEAGYNGKLVIKCKNEFLVDIDNGDTWTNPGFSFIPLEKGTKLIANK